MEAGHSLLPRPRALWGASHREPAARPALSGETSVDVAIVGGGIAGLSTALHLTDAGASVAVIEAGRVASGATGASAGIVAPQMARATPRKVRARLGVQRGDALLRLVAESGRCVFDLVDRYAIDCDPLTAGFLAPAAGRGAERALAEVVAEWGDLRRDLAVLDAAETARLSGCVGYGAALLDRSGGALDPVLYARGLAAAAEAAGVTIYEGSEAASVTRDGEGVRVATSTGVVRARSVVLAANGGNGGLRAELAGSVLPLPVWQVATERLPDEMRAVILPERHALTDLEPDIFSIRHAAGGRLITALPGPAETSASQLVEAVNRRLKASLQVYRPLALDYAWHGLAWVNTSLLPRLTRLEDGVIAIQACNGRGIAMNTVVGREVARLLGGAEALLPLEPPARTRGFAFARHAPRLLMAAAMLAKRARRAAGL